MSLIAIFIEVSDVSYITKDSKSIYLIQIVDENTVVNQLSLLIKNYSKKEKFGRRAIKKIIE